MRCKIKAFRLKKQIFSLKKLKNIKNVTTFSYNLCANNDIFKQFQSRRLIYHIIIVHNCDYDLNIIFAILNGRVTTAINKQFLRNCKEEKLDITPEQWTVLVHLVNNNGVTQQALCNATFKDKPSMTRLIDNMEKMGLVTRLANKKDRRINQIQLTRKGRDTERRSAIIAIKTLKEALEGINVEDIAICQDVLKKVFKNMQG